MSPCIYMIVLLTSGPAFIDCVPPPVCERLKNGVAHGARLGIETGSNSHREVKFVTKIKCDEKSYDNKVNR